MHDENFNGRPDNHEAQMARADLYKLANYSMKLFKMIQEGQELEGWVQAKITKAADYIASVYHYMEYEMKASEYGDHLESAEMYSESVKIAFQQKLMEAKAEKVKKEALAKKKKADEKVEEGFGYNKFGKKTDYYSSKSRRDADRDDEGWAKSKKADDEFNKKVASKGPYGDKKTTEGIEDKIEAAREKAAAKGKIKDKEPEKKSAVRKVAGKAYGGSKQKDDGKVDEAVDSKSKMFHFKVTLHNGTKNYSVSADNLTDAKAKVKHKAESHGDVKSIVQINKTTTEGIEDKIEAAREKAAAKGKIKDKEDTPKSNVRKVAGKAYGGSKQKDDEKVDEGFEDMFKAAEKKKAEKGTGKFDSKETSTGKVYTRKASTYNDDSKTEKKSKSVKEAAKPDFLDVDKDGDKKEPMKKALKDKKTVKESSDIKSILQLAGLKPLLG
jgi:hypothetical protein